MKEKRTTFTVSFSDSDLERMGRIVSRSDFADLKLSRNTILRYILTAYENLEKEMQELKAETKTVIASALTARTAAPKPEKLSYIEKKRLEEKEERDRALAFAAQLEGRVEGDICYFVKYDMYPTGRVVTNRVSENIFNLNEKFVASQYYPSKEEWLAKKKAQDEREAAQDAAQKAN